MRPGLHRPERDRAIRRQRVRLRPVDLPGLLLHHDRPRPLLQAANQVVVEPGQVGMTGARPIVGIEVRQQILLDLSGRVAVPRHEIKHLGALVVVDLAEMAHAIVGDEASGRGGAYDLDLQVLEIDDRVARKAVEVERVRWIRVVHGQIRWVYLIPVAVFLAPEDPAPRLVQSLE